MSDREHYLEERITRLESDLAAVVRTLDKIADTITYLENRTRLIQRLH